MKKQEENRELMRDSQYWSKIAKAHLDEINKKEVELHGDRATIQTMITQGDLKLMEELLDLFCDRQAITKKFADLGYGPGYYHKYGFQLVMDRLDRESQKSDAIFRKCYICYNGIINRPTRCFTVIDK